MSANDPALRQALDDGAVRGMQTTQVGLLAGVVLFAGAVWVRANYLAGPSAKAGPLAEDLVAKIALGVAVAFLVLQRIAHSLFVSRIRATKGEPPARRLEALRAAYSLRLALLEAPALIGIALCFLGTAQGPPENFLVWAGMIPAGLFVFFAAVSFPSRERLMALLTEL